MRFSIEFIGFYFNSYKLRKHLCKIAILHPHTIRVYVANLRIISRGKNFSMASLFFVVLALALLFINISKSRG